MVFFLIVFGVQLAVSVGGFVVLDKVDWRGLSAMLVAAAIVAGLTTGISSCSNTQDYEVWNGVVTDKQKVTVSCSHSYQCNCVTTCSGGKNQTCTTTCSTCYEHSHDYDWSVFTSNKETIDIERVDRQGVHMPERFKSVIMGEPTAVTHSFTNYVKAAPDSLFRHQGLKEKYAATVPVYPQEVYDYYRLNRLVTAVPLPNPVAWNNDLSQLNARLGALKQVNVILVVVSDKPHDWYYALEESWIGGKKNDVVLVVSVDSTLKPQWVETMAWTTNEMVKVRLRDDIMDLPKLDRDQLMVRLVSDVETFYVRKPMKDFEYLGSEARPSGLQWSLSIIIGLLLAGGLLWVFQTQDVFRDFRRSRRYY